MKYSILLLLAAGIAGCNSNDKTAAPESTDTKVAAATTETSMDYAYTIKQPDNWVTGSKENTKMVLASLKDWENGDFATCMKSFADSVQLNFDGFQAKLPKDSIAAMFASDRKNYESMKIEMEDFESVKSKDGTEEYVSLWYKQKSQLKGKPMDSVVVMDDLKIANGKILSIDEKLRHYPKKKS
jgi:hypothetical protein